MIAANYAVILTARSGKAWQTVTVRQAFLARLPLVSAKSVYLNENTVRIYGKLFYQRYAQRY